MTHPILSYLIAVESADPQNPGIAIEYETEQGDIIDVAYTEVKGEDNNKDVDVYTYEDNKISSEE